MYERRMRDLIVRSIAGRPGFPDPTVLGFFILAEPVSERAGGDEPRCILRRLSSGGAEAPPLTAPPPPRRDRRTSLPPRPWV